MSAEDVREAVGALKSALALAGLEYVEPALGTLTEHLERLERLNSELTLGQEYMEKWSDRGDFLCYRHEWLALEERAEAAEARVRELVTLVRIGFLVTVDGGRATADTVAEPGLRALLFSILQAEDTAQAVVMSAAPRQEYIAELEEALRAYAKFNDVIDVLADARRSDYRSLEAARTAFHDQECS